MASKLREEPAVIENNKQNSVEDEKQNKPVTESCMDSQITEEPAIIEENKEKTIEDDKQKKSVFNRSFNDSKNKMDITTFPLSKPTTSECLIAKDDLFSSNEESFIDCHIGSKPTKPKIKNTKTKYSHFTRISSKTDHKKAEGSDNLFPSTKNMPLNCPICNARVMNKDHLRGHMRMKFEKQCTACKLYFENCERLSIHQNGRCKASYR